MCAPNKTKEGKLPVLHTLNNHLICQGARPLGCMSRMEVFRYQAWISCQCIALQVFYHLGKMLIVTKHIADNNSVFTALHKMQTRSSDENSVRPSVCLSVRLSVTRVYCDKTEERSVQIFIPYERTFSLVFWEEEWLVGEGDPFYLKFWVNSPALEKNRRFSTNNRS